MNILLIEQIKVFRALWNKTVTSAGLEPIVAVDANKGLSVVMNRHIDVICVALSLPDIDGIEFTRYLRSRKQYQSVPIILLTSTQDLKTKQRAFESGVTDIQNKDDVKTVFDRARKIAERQQQKLKGRVLYIEDSRVVSHMMVRNLRELSLEVDHYRSASEAFTVFQQADYDLIISDILVEGEMSGVSLVSAVRELTGDKSRVPILAVSGMDDPGRRTELFRLGINDFVPKTASNDEIRVRVSNLISNKQLLDQVQAQQAYLTELAMVDQLTGLYNRNWLGEMAPKFFSDANRHDLPLSLLIIDIDHFKQVNDQHGHQAGDRVLTALGELIRKQCRQEDLAVRLGGEEFLVLMRQGDFAGACKRAEQLRQRVAACNPGDLSITVSIGLCSRPLNSQVKYKELFKAADQALYEAKQGGRNRVSWRRIDS